MDLLKEYRTLFHSDKNILSLEQLTCQDVQVIPSHVKIYGLIKQVTAGGRTSRSAFMKTIYLTDPTGQLTIESEDKLTLIPGNILRMNHVIKTAMPRSFRYNREVNGDLDQIPSLTFDYEAIESGSFKTNHFLDEKDVQICKFLELWQATCILSFQFSQLTRTGGKCYIDFACQVLAQRTTRRNVNLVVSDGSICGVPVQDQFKQDYAVVRPEFGNSFERSYEPMMTLLKDRLVHICVWANESNFSIDHFSTCCQVIPGDKAYLLFLNIEVSPSGFNDIMLSMRSGHHQGKAVRIISPTSILGKLLSQRLESAISQVTQLQSIESSSTFDDSYFDVGSDFEEEVENESFDKTPSREDWFKKLPSHITRQSLMALSQDQIELYIQLIKDADKSNFQANELGGLAQQEMIEILQEMIKN